VPTGSEDGLHTEAVADPPRPKRAPHCGRFLSSCFAWQAAFCEGVGAVQGTCDDGRSRGVCLQNQGAGCVRVRSCPPTDLRLSRGGECFAWPACPPSSAAAAC
jgi:hypothetical protein